MRASGRRALDPVGGRGHRARPPGWINSGLMTFFFFVVGLEARREFDLGELRDRRASRCLWSPALGGAFGAVAIYLAINAGRPSAHGWGVAMSTDTAFALGAARARRAALPRPPACVPAHGRRRRRPRRAARDRVFYSSSIDVTPLARRGRVLPAVLVLHRARRPGRPRVPRCSAPAPGWGSRGGRRAGRRRARARRAPVRVPGRARALERATERFREFREQPTAGLARTRRGAPRGDAAERAAAAALPPVDELRRRAAVRARERRHRDRRRPARARRHARRSRSASCSATCSASRSASSARRGSSRG